ncbi:MAG: fumarylacetoacetate hydrolase family protein [Notoacmeibacter sp.]|nr:fumarylacetoacetate hydrolase family protein [Notoacmeibacter sp.]
MTAADRLFDIPLPPVLAVQGEASGYPVHRIFCVGRNYAEHAKEMGYEVDREKPFYFTKSATHAVLSGATVPYPPGTDNYHYEVELVVAIGRPVFQASVAEAEKAVFGYACGLDMTRRDLQLSERAKQRPWDLGKDVEQSAVLAGITKAADVEPIGGQAITLTLDGETRQSAKLSELVWSIPEIISHLSGFYHLGPGDLVFTGTPAGVGPVVPGSRIEGRIDGLEPVRLTIDPAKAD